MHPVAIKPPLIVNQLCSKLTWQRLLVKWANLRVKIIYSHLFQVNLKRLLKVCSINKSPYKTATEVIGGNTVLSTRGQSHTIKHEQREASKLTMAADNGTSFRHTQKNTSIMCSCWRDPASNWSVNIHQSSHCTRSQRNTSH